MLSERRQDFLLLPEDPLQKNTALESILLVEPYTSPQVTLTIPAGLWHYLFPDYNFFYPQ